MLRKSKTLVGVDIGSVAVKAVELGPSHRFQKVLAYDIEPLPAGAVVGGVVVDEAAVSGAIRRLFDRRLIRSRHVAAALPGRDVLIKRITLPAMSDDELAASIHWEAEQHIPAAIEEVNLDYQLLASDEPSDDGTIGVLLVAATKESIARQVSVITAGGGKAVVLDVPALALQNVYEANYGTMPDALVLLIDAGASTTTITLVRSDEPLVTRHIPSSADVVSELQNTLGSWPGTRSFDRVLVSGGASRAAAFVETLAEQLQTPVAPMDPFRRIAFDPTSVTADRSALAATFALAVGLALRRRGDRWSA